MTAQQIIFLIIALFTLGSALMVVTSRNLVHAALWLVSTLFCVALIYALLNANFIAVVQVVIYIGAIAILFIFAVMLTRRDMRDSGPQLNRNWWLGALVALLSFSGLVTLYAKASGGFLALLLGGGEGFAKTAADLPSGFEPIGLLGEALVSPEAYVLPFEVASVLLLAALVGAVYVAFNPRSGDSKK